MHRMAPSRATARSARSRRCYRHRCQTLRLRDNDCTGYLDGLHEAERNVARARRQIDNEHVELRPFHSARELLHRLRYHGPAPDRRRSLAQKETEADERESHHFNRNYVLVSRHANLLRAVLDSEQDRHTGAVDIGVEEADYESRANEREGEADCDRTLSNAALSRTDGDDVADVAQPDAVRPWVRYSRPCVSGVGSVRNWLGRWVRFDYLDSDECRAHCGEAIPDRDTQPLGDGLVSGAERQLNLDLGPAHGDMLHHPERHYIARQPRVVNVSQRAAYLINVELDI